jgi:hypothetical protein
MSSPSKAKKSKADSIVARLTDTSKYTGAHKQRFNEDGSGRGLAGRSNLVNYTGSTNADEIVSSAAKGGKKKPVVKAGLGKQKYGVQAVKVPFIKLFRNGDKHHKGEMFKVKFNTFDQMKVAATNSVQLVTGAVQKFYKVDLRTRVTKLEDFEDGQSYLCCGGEKPKKDSVSPQLGYTPRE